MKYIEDKRRLKRMMAGVPMTAKDIADTLGLSPFTVRRFLREDKFGSSAKTIRMYRALCSQHGY